MRKQCQMLGITRSTLYYRSAGISERDNMMMNILDDQYTKTPFYGVLRMRETLRANGYKVGKCHVRTLLRTMGLEAVFAKPSTSKPHSEHRIYPYLLTGVTTTRQNQVWSTDITYISLRHGFAYLGGDHGLVQSVCIELAAIEHIRQRILRGGTGRGTKQVRKS
ncbi:MAG: hypothetical protein BWY26_01041 [Elusimicrobia bacterium ADurb.Bin231]|nr:MAG: hypothetical protein BWY26_01041 [Elusimicrobia bacterium ADurb.Bin231]